MDEHAKDELGDETVERARRVLADDGDIIQDWRACPYVAHPILVGGSTDKHEVAADRSDEHAKDELGDETVERARRVLADDGDIIQDRRACPYVAHPILVGGSTDKYEVAADRSDEHAKDELGDETVERARRVLADDGDIIQDRRACPYVLCSPHLDRRLDRQI